MSAHIPNGMSEADRAPMYVDLGGVKVEFLDAGNGDGAERLVDLPHCDVILVDARYLQQLLRAKHRRYGKVNRRRGCITEACTHTSSMVPTLVDGLID